MSQTLEELRKKIDDVDRRILELLNERASLNQLVGKVKGNDTPIYVPSRERQLVQNLMDSSTGPFPREAVSNVFREIVSACRSLQKETSVAFLGPEGSYHHAAGLKQFGKSALFVPVNTISQIFDQVERRKADYGIVAIENSTEGGVAVTMDRFAESTLHIVSEVYLPIANHLLSRHELHQIRKVYSHPQALAQCRFWLEQNLPDAVLVETTSTTQGAIIAKDEVFAAAVAGDLTAEVVDIPIAVRNIEDLHGNTTRFFVIGKVASQPTKNDKSAMIVYIRDEVGALYKMLEPLMEHRVNLSNLVSRPTRKQAWQYMFFIELNGHERDESVQKALDALRSRSLHVQWLGSFPCGNLVT